MVRLDIKYKTLLSRNGINNPLRIAHFMGQVEHESNFKPVRENLNYSAQGLANTWPTRYAVDPKSKVKVPNDLAHKLHRKPEAIANNAYADRMGNGGEGTGDGWKYRGAGLLQITGKSNFAQLSADTGVDYLSNPNLLMNEADSLIAALWFWNKNNLSSLADKDDVVGITKKINGGTTGLSDRIAKVSKWKKLLGIQN